MKITEKKFDFGRKFTKKQMKSIDDEMEELDIAIQGPPLPGFVIGEFRLDAKFPCFWDEILFAKGTTEGRYFTPDDKVNWDEPNQSKIDLSDLIADKTNIEKKFDFVNFYKYPTSYFKSWKQQLKFIRKEDVKLNYYMKVYSFVKENPDFQDLHKIDIYFSLFKKQRDAL